MEKRNRRREERERKKRGRGMEEERRKSMSRFNTNTATLSLSIGEEKGPVSTIRLKSIAHRFSAHGRGNCKAAFAILSCIHLFPCLKIGCPKIQLIIIHSYIFCHLL
jgi:hypothetical protein